ncbi:protein snail homolog Sna-like [Galendromus occidentalis]|uniref:Protein snail homolog Sna-like n=1 Tax=Galendromus occidentalis TaxID=34638 RepID=A0AAJ7WIM9_9ACAR|nr:protein snail homolog Sna-like [Galendromus occidentalis]
MSSTLSGVKRPWLDEPVRTVSSDGPQSEGPEDLSTNSERSSFSVSPSPSETATVPEIHSTPFDLSTKRQRLSSVSSDGSPTFRLPRTPLSPKTTPMIPPMIAPLLDPWNPLLYPLPALYYSSLCANLSAQTFRPQILTHEKPQDAVVPSWETVSSNNNNNSINVRSPTGSNRFTCDDCQKSYSTFAGLSKHKEFHCVNSASGRKEFCCKYCSKSYVSMGALKMHIRTHTLPCKCDICGKAFSRPWLLQGHIRTHTGEKPFECEHCHRAFADRSNLRAHLQTHQEVKKYSCARCSKTFSRMSLLQKHQDSMSCVASRSESSLSSRSSS